MMRRLCTSTLSGGVILVASVLATGPTLADTGSEPQGAQTTPGTATTTPGQPGTVTDPGQEPSSPGAGKQQPTSRKPNPPKHKGGKSGDSGKPNVKGKKKAKQGKQTTKSGGTAIGAQTPIASVTNLQIEAFDVPPFALQYYMAAGSMYGVPWQLLTAIHYVETNFSTNLSVSSAGAVGHMQFLPSTWDGGYATDADGDGLKDPYSLPDSIFAAARYLRAAAGDAQLNIRDKNEDALRKAVFAYNHSDVYVNDVLGLAKRYAKLPPEFVNALVELSSGIFPVQGNARYAKKETGNVATIYARRRAPVVAVTAGKIVRMDANGFTLLDPYGNKYYYGNLDWVAPVHPVPKPTRAALEKFRRQANRIQREADSQRNLPAPSGPATAGDLPASGRAAAQASAKQPATPQADRVPNPGDSGYRPNGPTLPTKERLFAHPSRTNNKQTAAALGQFDAAGLKGGRAWTVFTARYRHVLKPDPRNYVMRPLKVGSQVTAGTLLGQVNAAGGASGSGLTIKVRPAGKGSPLIDPTPLITTWKLREETSARGLLSGNPLKGGISAGQVLLLPDDIIRARVLNDPRIRIYPCGRNDIRTGKIKEQVLGALEYLAESGFRMTVTSLSCGHSRLTASGNPSAHPFGLAVDIAEINGEPVLGNQQPGGPADQLIDRLLALQGKWEPNQIISLIPKGRPNTLVLADHNDHVHVGYPVSQGNSAQLARRFKSILTDGQWKRLGERMNAMKNPIIPKKASRWAIRVKHR